MLKYFIMSILLAGCFSSEQPRTLSEGSSSSFDQKTGNSPGKSVKLPQDINFLQEGTRKDSVSLSFPSDFDDSFLIRGNVLSSFLRKIPFESKFCLALNFNASTDNKLLVMSTQIKIFNDLSSGTNEYYFRVTVNDEETHQNDCLTGNLTSTLMSEYGIVATDIAYAYEDLCPGCTI